MKKMNSAEMSKVNGGAFLAVVAGWIIGRTAVCGFAKLFKC